MNKKKARKRYRKVRDVRAATIWMDGKVIHTIPYKQLYHNRLHFANPRMKLLYTAESQLLEPVPNLKSREELFGMVTGPEGAYELQIFEQDTYGVHFTGRWEHKDLKSALDNALTWTQNRMSKSQEGIVMGQNMDNDDIEWNFWVYSHQGGSATVRLRQIKP